jgi:hypothetical protein
LIATAQGKGWDTLEFTGSPDFQEKAAIAALQAGLYLADKDLEDRVYPRAMLMLPNQEAQEAEPAPPLGPRGRGPGGGLGY